MAFYIDSSNYVEIEKAIETGWVYGITTNPVILKQNMDAPEVVLKKMSEYLVAEVFYQIKSTNLDLMRQELGWAEKILGNKLVAKIPPTPLGFNFTSRISSNYPTCVTAIFSPAQAMIAKEVGATYIAVYINRATKLLGNGIQLAKQLSSVLRDSKTKILAASIKSVEELVNTAQTGIGDFTLPFSVLDTLSEHPASLDAVQDFDNNGTHLKSFL